MAWSDRPWSNGTWSDGPGVVTHATSGVLANTGAAAAATATRFRAFATSGVLTGSVSTVAGSANRFRAFATNGILVGATSVIAGDAAKKILHTTDGILVNGGARIAGIARHSIPILYAEVVRLNCPLNRNVKLSSTITQRVQLKSRFDMELL